MNRVYGFFKGKGFYLALLACILAAAMCSVWAIRTVTQQLGKKNEPLPKEDLSWELPQKPVEQKVKNVPITEPEPVKGYTPPASQEGSSSPSTSSGQPGGQSVSTEPAAAQDSGFVQPVSGQVIAEYSGAELVYNETLGDWRTHNGADIACADDASVKACAGGEVTAIYDNGLYGVTVEVSSGDLVYRYCGLAPKPDVDTGDKVEPGTRLGGIGTVKAEADKPTHLHFEVLEGGNYRDPMEILAG